jgi:hypothetical protein
MFKREIMPVMGDAMRQVPSALFGAMRSVRFTLYLQMHVNQNIYRTEPQN